jgi:hypothetical protein
MEDDIKRWTAKRKTALILDIIQGKTTVAEASRAYDLPPSDSGENTVQLDLILIEFDHLEARSLVKVFANANLERFLQERWGHEAAHEAMSAVKAICVEARALLPPSYLNEEQDYYSVSVELSKSQAAELLRYARGLTIEDVRSWGCSLKDSKEVINAMWCIKESIIRNNRNIDRPLR